MSNNCSPPTPTVANILDTGAGGMFMHLDYTKKHKIILHKLRFPITPRNVDGTENQAGKITHFTWVQTRIDGRKSLERLLVSNIGSSDIIFGLPWFKEHNPFINWNTGNVQILQNAMKAFKGYQEKKTRRERDLKNLEIANIQMKLTDDQSLPPQKERMRNRTEKSSHTLKGEQKTRCSDSLNWRQRFKERKKETKEKHTKTHRRRS